jgi:ribosomal protein L12E/L44/L45/RPP1/RPP2
MCVCVCISLTYMSCVFDCRKREATADGSANPTAADAFAVDLTDSRFSALLSRDGRFGIDTTSNEFKSKDTKEMKRLLAAQRSSAAAAATNSAAAGMNTHKKKQQQQQQQQAKAAEEEEYKLLGKHSKHASMGGAAANSHHNGINNNADNADNDGDLHNQLAERLKKKFKK